MSIYFSKNIRIIFYQNKVCVVLNYQILLIFVYGQLAVVMIK